MPWTPTLTKLRDLLADLYDDDGNRRRVAAEAGLPRERIDFAGTSVVAWHAILTAAQAHERLPELIAIARGEYSANAPLTAQLDRIEGQLAGEEAAGRPDGHYETPPSPDAPGPQAASTVEPDRRKQSPGPKDTGVTYSKNDPLSGLYAFLDALFWPMLLLCALLAGIIGGFLWNFANRLLDWTFYMGGSGNEPHGLQAFLWGIITVFPVIFLAFLGYNKYLRGKNISKLSAIALLYTLFGGLGAVLLYDSGFRSWIEAQQWGYGSQEIVIVLGWALVISLSTWIPVIVLNRRFEDIINGWELRWQVVLAMGFAVAGVVAFLIVPPAWQTVPLRGVAAAIPLRLGLFFGICLAIVKQTANKTVSSQGFDVK